MRIGEGRMDSTPSHVYMDSRGGIPEDHHWSSIQHTDLLNNQVPPGTRANNYWDNFRSYSRQNLLSSSTKSNASESHQPQHSHHPIHMAFPSTVTSAATPHALQTSSSAGQLHMQSREREDKRFNVSINNSSGGPIGGARARVPEPHLNNGRGGQQNPRVRNPVSPSHHPSGQNKHKANNRNKQVSRDRAYINYNQPQNSDTDVNIDVMREAEALMRRHASQPDFLVQLFRNAAQITVHTDQHVAVALLQDLAQQPHRSHHGVNNREDNANLSLPTPLRDSLRDSWRPQPTLHHPTNVLPQESVAEPVSQSASEVSDSGLTSEDEDSRALYRNVKNLSLSPGGRGGQGSGQVGGLRRGGGQVGGHEGHLRSPGHRTPYQYRNTVDGQYQENQYQFPYQYYHTNHIGNEGIGGRSTGGLRSGANSESSLYDHLVYNESLPSDINSRQVVEEWMCSGERAVGERAGERVGERVGPTMEPHKLNQEAATVTSSPEDAITHPLNNDTEYLTFESLVASAVREGVEILQGASEARGDAGVVSSAIVSPILVSSLHRSLVSQIETQAQSLRLPQSFLYSIEAELKQALHCLTGKRIGDARNEVASIVSQVLLTQYCSVLVQRLRDNNPALPHTPTKLLHNVKGRDISEESLASTMSDQRHDTTATQTDMTQPSYSLHSAPHQNNCPPTPPFTLSNQPSPQTSHPLQSSHQNSLFHPSYTLPSPLSTLSAPPPAPLPSPNEPQADMVGSGVGVGGSAAPQTHQKPEGGIGVASGASNTLSGSQNQIASLSGAQNQLSGSQNQHSGSQNHLSGTQNHLSGAQNQLASLSGSQNHLSGAQNQLSGSQNHLSGTQNHLSGAQNQIASLSGAQNQLSGTPNTPTPKPDLTWAAGGTESSTPTPAGAEGAGGMEWEVEIEEGLIDELGDGLAVHALAEADQSQDAVEGAEGEWENSQAEGDVGAASPSNQHSPHTPPQSEADGHIEAEEDAAEGSIMAASGGTPSGGPPSSDMAAQVGNNREQELDEVPTKLQSPEGDNSSTTSSSATDQPVQQQPMPQHSPGSEG